ncbi:molybdopterin-guanine dinucleotide biosynthesis protein B [Agarivorans sp. TSD2052]|uniref:molybdopterin-guanine dinucleotide biosynthesis protein B n=1 Tax=Agarivorans sp. TSD2052 TaxID=2937286 RepID=UPI00200FE833|nr:molybdopterin-guanine dinucleotide biosynthesis protein B [Agarivorans sp. TSD2052]UPW20450.1 molybdopterin-guanine dinucleotide biosynthesis protein B [Agarivorans sp. TSD2052]
MDKKWPKPVLGIAGFSGSGKTRLLSEILPLLIEKKLRVTVIKHSHHTINLDDPTKDSHKLTAAGASEVILSCPNKRYHFSQQHNHDSVEEQLNWVNWAACDLVLVEGYRHSDIPKIEVYREQLGKPLLSANDESIIAVASPNKLESSLTILDLNKPNLISEFIVNYTNNENL